MATPKPIKKRALTRDHDTDTPAFKIVHGVFGGPSTFARATGIKLTTAQEWLLRGYVPGWRIAHIRAAAEARGIKLDPLLFVPAPALDPDTPLPA